MANILLGVCSSIAAFKVIDLVRLQKGNCVDIIMTKNACKIIDPKEFEKITKKKVVVSGFRKGFDYRKYLNDKKEIKHISLADKADILVVVPATANIIGKVANGIADDLLSTTIMATDATVVFCPAMNSKMWNNPIVKANVSKLKKLGYHFVDPLFGELACGYSGKGRLAPIEEICTYIVGNIGRRLEDRKIIVTAGGTSEAIDDVRVITNRSSGKMGVAIAEEAYKQGAEVLLLKGKNSVDASVPSIIEFDDVKDLFSKIKENIKKYDTMIHAAAVSDFTVDKKNKKIKSDKKIKLELKPTIKIIDKVKKLNPKIKLVGFKLESVKGKKLVDIGYDKLKRSGADFIVCNNVSAIGSGDNSVSIIDKNKKIVNIKGNKRDVAKRLLEVII